MDARTVIARSEATWQSRKIIKKILIYRILFLPCFVELLRNSSCNDKKSIHATMPCEERSCAAILASILRLRTYKTYSFSSQ
ncbi:MAG TPA: hypothetical protein LFV92_04155 [Rickettsia endosymbiont of Ceroptres masudai]|nr:hypothetical protein [Rickettsia endosymbiont of Ceroptres masudai]